MKLLCVVLNYRTADMTIDAVEAARKALAGMEGYRIDVVDNDSGDGSYEKLAEAKQSRGWDDVQVMPSGHNGGFGAGNNFAMRKALASEDPPDYIYLLNSDAFPAPDAIRILLDFMDANPKVGFSGSYIHGTDDKPHLTAFRFPSVASEALSGFRLGFVSRFLRGAEVPIRPMPTETREVDWLAGASMMMRRECLEDIGLFDETFFLYFEETDLCRRAQLAGWPTWYVVESKVAHVGGASTGNQKYDRPMPTYWFDSRRHYFVKNHGAAYTWMANLVHAVGLTTLRLRSFLQRKENELHVNFLRDFSRYNFLRNRP